MLGCIQPMSSPMMKRIFGFCVAACANALALTPTIDAAHRPIVTSFLKYCRRIPLSCCYLLARTRCRPKTTASGARSVPRELRVFADISFDPLRSRKRLSAVMILREAPGSVPRVEGQLLGCVNLVLLKFLEKPFIGQIQGVRVFPV